MVASCVSSSGVTKAPTPQEKEVQQKQALKARITATMAEQNRRIDSLIAVNDKRLQKDKNGNYIRPNWVSASGTPLYYSANKRSARKSIKADALNSGGALGVDLNGEGIHIGIWDDGHIFAGHNEFTGGADFFGYQVPIEIADADEADIRDGHPTAVASIVIAKGVLDSDTYDITGISPQLAKVYSYDWKSDVYEIFEQLQTNSNTDFILSNHSYGIPILDDNNELILEVEEIGGYSEWSSFIDEITYAYPNYLHVVAGGNDGYKSYPSQSVGGLDQLTGSTTAKNALTVGSFSMDNNSENITATEFSSAGPTNDYRIKPEICAAGQALGTATWDENNPEDTDEYTVTSGTSFAAPGTAAGVALLQQLYKQTHNAFMRGATAKALLCHTADDITQWGTQDITGPDVKTGYGAVNLEKASALIQNDVIESNTIVEFELDENDTKKLYFHVHGEGILTATLSWYDPHATENTSTTLINDLDLRILQESSTYFPWKLPVDAQQTVAVLGDNSRDNLEQIKISENLDGIYEVEVSHKGVLHNGSQEASLIISGPGFISMLTPDELDTIGTNGFLITPIPAKDFLSVIVIKNDTLFRTVRLLNLQGSEVATFYKSSFTRTPLRFDTSYVPTGSYILAIETQNETVFKNVIIR